MKKKLFIKAFEKAQIQSGAEKPNGIVKHLSNILQDKVGYGISDRNLTRYFNKYIEGKEESVSPKPELLDAISEYIGCDNYEDFVTKNIQLNGENSLEMGTRTVNQYGDKSIYLENNSSPINIS